MVYIRTFDTPEEMFEAESQDRKAADDRVQWWQAKIKKGDFFKQWTEYGFYIYGEVLDEYTEGHLKNYRLCDCFSEGCPDGEIGDVHISQISALLSREEYEAEKAKVKNQE